MFLSDKKDYFVIKTCGINGVIDLISEFKLINTGVFQLKLGFLNIIVDFIKFSINFLRILFQFRREVFI